MKDSQDPADKPLDRPVQPATASETAGVPTDDVIRYVRRLLLRRYRLDSVDIEDLVAESLLDYLKARGEARENQDGLFLTIAHRRACDFWRKRKSELSLAAAQDVATRPSEGHLEAELLQRTALRYLLNRNRLDKDRVLGVLREILAGASFPEACRANGIPRGSQMRYRETLRQCFGSCVTPHPERARPIGPACRDRKGPQREL